MKSFILSLTIISTLLVACNNNQVSDNTEAKASSNKDLPKGDTPVASILNDYLEIKNALTRDSDSDAASAASKLANSLKAFDKTTLSPEQTAVFDDIQEDALEHAEHIASNKGNIVHQREHFETLSGEVYELVKATGAGQKLYYTNCPMYNDNKGANWLSETKEVSNPYLGQAMLTCGSVQEELN